MASKDLNELRNKLFNERYEILSISDDYTAIDNNPSIKTTIVLEKGGNQITIQSSEPDLLIYASQLQNVVNGIGEDKIVKVKDTGLYYSDIEHLIDIDHTKIKKAADDITNRRFVFTYNFSTLVDEFLVNPRNVECDKFITLKKDYHYILASTLSLSEQMLEIHRRLNNKYSEAKDLINSIDKIMRVFLKTGNAIKDYKFYKTYINFNIDELASRASTQLVIVNDTMREFKKRHTIDAAIAIPRMMNLYGRLLEILRPLINLIRIGVELRGGNQSPEKEYPLTQNIMILKSDQEYSTIFSCLDDQIRHSDAHASVRIDKATRKVYLMDTRGKKDTVACIYTFDELTNKINVMLNEFYPAVFPTIILFDISILDVLLVSREYKLRLLSLGNC